MQVLLYNNEPTLTDQATNQQTPPVCFFASRVRWRQDISARLVASVRGVLPGGSSFRRSERAVESLDFLQAHTLLQRQRRLFATNPLAVPKWIHRALYCFLMARMHYWNMHEPIHPCCNLCWSGGGSTEVYVAKKKAPGHHCYGCNILRRWA